jgi:hypothetical protein
MKKDTLYLDNNGGSDINIGAHDQLYLDFQLAGCFESDHPRDFDPYLPVGYHQIEVCGPYRPIHSNHDTEYCFAPNTPCPCNRGMHTIHTGS